MDNSGGSVPLVVQLRRRLVALLVYRERPGNGIKAVKKRNYPQAQNQEARHPFGRQNCVHLHGVFCSALNGAQIKALPNREERDAYCLTLTLSSVANR